MNRVLVNVEVIRVGKNNRETMKYFSRVPNINEYITLSEDDGPYQVTHVYHSADDIESPERDDIKATITVIG